MDYFLNMDFEDFIPQYIKSREKKFEEDLWIMYCHYHTEFNKDNYLPFNRFMELWTGKPTNDKDKNDKQISSKGKTDEELITDAETKLFKMEFVEKH